MRLIALFLVLCATICHEAPVNAQIPTNGLVAYFPFNGNANDESGNGNNGVVYGATLTTDRCNRSDSAYLFNGLNSYISVPPSKLVLNQFSFSAWVYLNVVPEYDSQFMVLDIGSNSGDQYINTPHYAFTIYDGLGGGGYNNGAINQYKVYQQIDPVIDQWSHIVVTRNVYGMKLYINGSLTAVDTSFNITTPYYGIGPIKANIGVRFDNSYFFNGKIDDVIIYNREITPEEVLQLYQFSCNTPKIIISGEKVICAGQKNVSYFVQPVDNATSYNWGYSGTGATIHGNSDSITIDFSDVATSGDLSVMVKGNSFQTLIDTMHINIKTCNESEFNIPNAFSPNGDGINEVFKITGLMDNSKLIIFDRMGKKLYESDNYQNDWDGKDSNGNILESGTYWYVLKMPGYPDEFKGFVFLKR